MRILAIAIASSGLLVAPMAMADCDRELDRIEQRVEQANLDPQNETRLLSWLERQREVYEDASGRECSQVASEITRQMQEYGYFSTAGTDTTATFDRQVAITEQTRQSGARQTSDIELDEAEVLVDAPASEVTVDQPAARVNVEQQPADVDVKMQEPRVVVQVPEPEVRVTQPSPNVTVSQPDPEVTVNQPDPIVNVQQPDPNVTVEQADPQVLVRQDEPDVRVQDSPTRVNVETAEPRVQVDQSGTAQVQVREQERDQQRSQQLAQQRGQQDQRATQQQRQQDQRMAQQDRQQDQRTAQQERQGSQSGMQANQLVGMTVVDQRGRTIGEVSEVLKEQRGDQLFVLVSVDSSSDLDSEEILLGARDLERDQGSLKTRQNARELDRAGNFALQNYQPASNNETVRLAGSDVD